jgi:hypothetical protein
MSSFSRNDSKSSLKAAAATTQEAVVAASVKEPTINDTPNDPPILFSNIKSQGRVMVYDEETFGFKMVPDDQLVVVALDESARCMTNHDRKSSFHRSKDSFDFKQLVRKFSL